MRGGDSLQTLMPLKLALTLLVVTGAFAATLHSAPEALAKTRMCANAPGGDVVSARNTTCAEAHKLMRLWVAGVRRDDRYDRTVAKWSCRNRPNEIEGDVMRCRKGRNQTVRWYVNLP